MLKVSDTSWISPTSLAPLHRQLLRQAWQVMNHLLPTTTNEVEGRVVVLAKPGKLQFFGKKSLLPRTCRPSIIWQWKNSCFDPSLHHSDDPDPSIHPSLELVEIHLYKPGRIEFRMWRGIFQSQLEQPVPNLHRTQSSLIHFWIHVFLFQRSISIHLHWWISFCDSKVITGAISTWHQWHINDMSHFIAKNLFMRSCWWFGNNGFHH